MHDCREVESQMIDLVFDELGGAERSRILAEIETCPECLGQYSSMHGTIRIFDHALEASLPAESCWPQHHEALRRHLVLNSSPVTIRHQPFWKRFFALKLHVPVPVAGAVVVALLSLSILALRSSATPPVQVVTAQPLPAVQTLPHLVEVPVVQEKLITRTVYVEKSRCGMSADPDLSTRTQRGAPTVREIEGSQDRLFTRASLTDFQPPDEMRIRIIKRSKSDEK